METIGSLIKERSLYTIPNTSTVRDAASYMAEKNVGAVPVVEGDTLVGVFSERDAITRLIAQGLDAAKTFVKDVMTTQLVVATVDESVDDCLQKMQQAHCRHLPVIAEKRLVGFISLRDLLQKDLSKTQEDLEYLKSYMFTVPPDK